MDIETLYAEWDKDGSIDPTNLTRATTDIPKLHNKYYKLYVTEALKLRKKRAEYKVLAKLKLEWFDGKLDDETLKERGWQPFRLKILKSEMHHHLEADPEIIKLTLMIGLQEEIVSYLESIVKQIANRNFLIKNIIDYEKFKMGG